jgi:hypothetical protein
MWLVANRFFPDFDAAKEPGVSTLYGDFGAFAVSIFGDRVVESHDNIRTDVHLRRSSNFRSKTVQSTAIQV